MRITRESMMMQMAQVASSRSTCNRLNVGAIIAHRSRIISTGYNGSLPGQQHCHHAENANGDGCTAAVHAEANALMFAASYGVSTAGASMFTTHAPCHECAKLIVTAGISGVWYKYDYRSSRGLETLTESGVYLVRWNHGL